MAYAKINQKNLKSEIETACDIAANQGGNEDQSEESQE